MTIVPAIGLPTRLPKPCITNAKLIPRPKYLDSTIFFRDKLYPRFPPTKTQNSLIKIPWTKIDKIKIILYINSHLYGDIVYKECHDFTRRSLKSSVNKSCVYVTVDVNLSHCFISVDLIFHCCRPWLFVLFSYIGILYFTGVYLSIKIIIVCVVPKDVYFISVL
jgi:hypothetical protein